MEENVIPHREPLKDQQTVTPDGASITPRIDGLHIRPAHTIEDRRGEVVEIYRLTWNFHPDPLVFVYQITVRPHAIKGWAIHRKQDDRVYTCLGVTRWVFYDNRPESPTYQLLNDFTFSDRNRALLAIPAGVFHAVQNVGQSDAIFINMPTRPYDHADPDKYRLPLTNDLIPFKFDETPGW